ncbi:hypothetical protein [Hydrogenophaga sp.]|uniref:hypothetical protein n=1 Tax=Hydrogenophaga sp. TaxID=1904254 RepID=UPI002731EC7B|nr:hypothetical protein [Hydrogenophaga sp.]MDP1684475.1 hypothetical protein [Hydrogenophaga sp.]
MKKLLVIFLTYYTDYTRSSLNALESMLAMARVPYEIIIVNNGNSELSTKPHTLIAGDNSWNEFSGWQAGINHARLMGSLDNCLGVVLANDTLGHHNRFGLLSRCMFAMNLRKIINLKEPAAAGECWDFYTDYEVSGYRCSRWITTSLLMVNWAALPGLDPVIDPKITPASSADEYFRMFNVSKELKHQVQGWLGQIELPSGKPLWYGVENDDSPKYQRKIAQKTAMILLEYRLSARLAEHGAKLIDVFGGKLLPQLRRFEAKPVKVNKSHP